MTDVWATAKKVVLCMSVTTREDHNSIFMYWGVLAKAVILRLSAEAWV